MSRVLSTLLVALLGLPVAAAPRVFAPVLLKPGAGNAVYVWDEAPVGPVRVDVVRPEGTAALVTVMAYPVDRPLAALGEGRWALSWTGALVPLDALTAPGPVTVRFWRGKDLLAEVASAVAPRVFPEEVIPLDRAMSALRSQPDARKDKEAALIWKLYQTTRSDASWEFSRFRLPVPAGSRPSAQFGDVRLYRYADGTSARDYHRGVDFAVPVGTPVSSPAAGRVVLTADRLLTGTTVVVEHGPGVYSVFFHLSRTLVKVGQIVGAGDPLALSGATGLVTGPHLHWEVRIQGVPIDPLDVVVDGLLDTALASAVISSIERPIH